MKIISDLIKYIPKTSELFRGTEKEAIINTLYDDVKDYLKLKQIKTEQKVVTEFFFIYGKKYKEENSIYQNCYNNDKNRELKLKDKISGQYYPGYYVVEYNTMDLHANTTHEYVAICYKVLNLAEATSYVAEVDVAHKDEDCDAKKSKYEKKGLDVTPLGVELPASGVKYKLCVYSVKFQTDKKGTLKHWEKRNQLKDKEFVTGIVVRYANCPKDKFSVNEIPHKCVCSKDDENRFSLNGDKTTGFLNVLGSNPFYMCPGTQIFNPFQLVKK